MVALALRLFILAVTIAGCSSTSPGPQGGEAGAGGEAGSGAAGSGGEGGGGRGGGDPIVFALEITSPEEGATVVDRQVMVEGTVKSDVPLRQIRYSLNQGALQPIQARDGAFSFEVDLDEGTNVIQVGAENRAGETIQASRTITYENTPGRPPVIERFEANAAFYSRGSPATLSWRVTGTEPISLLLSEAVHAGNLDVSKQKSAQVAVDLPDFETFFLQATNEHGTATASVHIGVGEKLRLSPGDVILATGEKQRIVAENAAMVDWSSTGGELEPEDDSWRWRATPGAAVFSTTVPGKYTISATDRDHPSRTGSVTIEVRDVPSRIAGFHGIGGQFGYTAWYPTPVIDRDGTLWVQSPPAGRGVARWRADEGVWVWVSEGLDARIQQLAALPDGSLIAGGMGRLFRLVEGADRFEEFPAPWTEAGKIVGLEAMDEGEFLVALDSPPGLWQGNVAGTFEAISLPPALAPSAVAIAPDGSWYLGGTTPAGDAVVMSRASGAEGWSDTGSLPSPAGTPWHIAFGPQDEVAVACSRAIARLGDDGWAKIGVPRSDKPYRIAFDGAGNLVVPGRPRPMAIDPSGVARAYGLSDPIMNDASDAMSSSQEPIQAVIGDGTGGIYVAGNGGVYHVESSASAWTLIGTVGLPPSWLEIESSTIADDGSLVIGTLRRGYGRSRLYRLDAPERTWSGFGDAVEQFFYADPRTTALAYDGRGNLYTTDSYGYYRLPADGGPIEELPWIEGIHNGTTLALGVAGDGTLYAARANGSELKTYKLAPGAEEWKQEPSLECYSFLRVENGDLWGACGVPKKLANGGSRWTTETDGIPWRTTYVYEFAPDGAGGLLAAGWDGVFRRRSTSAAWERLGSGAPSSGAMHVAHGGGRTYCSGADASYELDAETSAWVRIPHQPAPPAPDGWDEMKVFLALPDGRLVVSPYTSGLGLFATFDR